MTTYKPGPKPKILLKKSLLAMVKNSVGMKTFKNGFGILNGREIDFFENGRRSCAVFLSMILFWFKLIDDMHAETVSTIKDMERNGWQKVEFEEGDLSPHSKRASAEGTKAEPALLECGDILVWEPYLWPAITKSSGEVIPGDKIARPHIGFYIGDDEAISNDYKTGTPQKHHFTYGTLRQAQGKKTPVRKITAIYRHTNISKKL